MRHVERAGEVPVRTYHFRTDDVDEAIDFVGRRFGPHTRVPNRRGPLGYTLSVAAAGHSAAGFTSLAVPSTVRAMARSVALHQPLEHGAEYRVGRRVLRSARNVAVVLAPGTEYSVLAPPGTCLGLVLAPDLLDRELEASRPACRRARVLRSMQLPLSAAEVETLHSLLKRHAVAVGAAQHQPAHEEMRASETRLASWLAARVVAADGLAALSPSGRDALRKAEDWIRQHLSQPVSLEQLSVAAGVSPRALQQACRARFGQSPMELVASRRLAFVRRLLASSAVPTVTEAAVRSGFAHLGRFSILYRRAFGESPSETLAARPRGPALGSEET